MFWIFLIVATLAIGLIKLGALSVWVTVLAAALKAGMVLALGLAIVFLALILLRKIKGA